MNTRIATTRTVELSPRERRVLALAAESYSDRQIADRLGVSQQTVRHQLSSVYRQLGLDPECNQRVAAALWWLRHGGEDGDR